MKRALLSLLVFGAMSTLVVSGQTPQAKPNLSGTWVFNAQKSTLKVPPPTSMTLQIEQNDPQISFARTQVYGDQNFDWKLEAVADGQKEVVQNTPAYTANSRVFWEGNSLILDQKMSAPDGTKVNDLVTYSLADDGKTLQAIERQTTVGAKGAVTNKWIYEKKAQ